MGIRLQHLAWKRLYLPARRCPGSHRMPVSGLVGSYSFDFIGKDEWPPNSPDINSLDYCVWGVMLAAYQKHNPKPTTKARLREVLQEIWDNLSQDCINKAVLGVRKRLRACVQADGGLFEHVL